MATISDQLAADISNAFAQTQRDLTNQDQFLFGNNNVQIRRQDGTLVSVKSWNKMIADLASTDSTVANHTTQIAAANSAINGKAGLTTANTFTQAQTFSKGITAASMTSNGNVDCQGLNARSIELSYSTPFIDFHHGNSTADYTHRIITESGALAIYPGLRVRGGFGVYGTGTVYQGQYAQGMIARLENDPSSAATGTIVASPRFTARFNTRGSDSNVDGSQCGMWLEEQVGTNHRMVFMLGGFGANVQYWQFLADGNINGSQRGLVAFQGSSDYRYKHDIEEFDGQQSLDLINQLGLVTFIYDNDEQKRVRRGIIAQQAALVDPQYVKLNTTTYRNEHGETITQEKLTLDDNVFLMDAICAIQVLDQKYAILSKRMAELEAANAL